MLPFNPQPKAKQLASNRIKPKQKTRGAISPKVRAEVRERSGGVCEVRIRCNGSQATEMAHIRGRRIISQTTAKWLRDACNACHTYLDNTGEGAVYKRQLREGEQTCHSFHTATT